MTGRLPHYTERLSPQLDGGVCMTTAAQAYEQIKDLHADHNLSGPKRRALEYAMVMITQFVGEKTLERGMEQRAAGEREKHQPTEVR